MISVSAADYFEYIYQCHCLSGRKRWKALAGYYLYQAFILGGFFHLIFMGCCILYDCYEDEIYHYIPVSYNIFYKWGDKNLYLVWSITIIWLFVIVLNDFILLQIPKLLKHHLDDVYDFMRLQYSSAKSALFCAQQMLLWRSYVHVRSESAVKIMIISFSLNHYSVRFVRILGEFIDRLFC